MGFIWSPLEKNFSMIKYEQTGDVSWLRNVKSRMFKLDGVVPFMLSNRGEFICIPKERDQMSLLITGCLDGDTEVIVDNELVPIKDVRVGQKCRSYDGVKMVEGVVTDVFSSFHLEKYKILINDGVEVICSWNHSFLIKRDGVEKKVILKDIKIDDLFPLVNNEGLCWVPFTNIIKISGLCELYDLTIDKYHNFSLGNLLLVGNSKRCMEENSLIFVNGGPKKIKDIESGDMVLTLNESNFKAEFKPVVQKIYQGEQPIIKFVSSQDEIKVTGNHKMLVYDMEQMKIVHKFAKDVSKNDFMPFVKKVPSSFSYLDEYMGFDLTEEFGFFCGMYLAEGIVPRIKPKNARTYLSNPFISVSDSLLKKYVCNIVKNIGFDYSSTKQGIRIKGIVQWDEERRITQLKTFLVSQFGTGSGQKKIPGWVFFSREKFKRGLLRGYFSGDGGISYRKEKNLFHISFLSKSESLINSLILLYKQFGIVFYKGVKRVETGRYKGNIYYRVRMDRESLNKFMDFSFVHIEKFNRLNINLRDFKCLQYFSKIPLNNLALRNVGKKYSLSRKNSMVVDVMRSIFTYSRLGSIGTKVLRNYLNRIVEYCPDVNSEPIIKHYFDLLDGDVIWRRYDSKEEIGVFKTYDITVEGNSNFMLMNGFFVHNSGKSLLLLSILGSVFYNHNSLCLHANDMTRETFTWHRRQTNKNVVADYWDYRRPKYLPMIHVLMMSKNLRLPDFRFPRWDVCLSFNDVLENPEDYLDLTKMASANYLSNMKERFAKEKDLDWDKVQSIIHEELSAKVKGKTLNVMYESIIARIQRLVKDGILDISGINPRADTYLKVKFKGDDSWFDFNVLSGLMAAGGIPVLHTDNVIHNKRFFKAYLSNQLEKVMDDMTSHSYFKEKKLTVFIDELQTLCDNKKVGDNSIIQELVAQGGPKGIGTVYSLQNPSLLPENILSNTKYFVTCQNTKSQARILTKEFSLEDRYSTIITGLNKNYRECLAYTTERFLVFNPMENEVSYEKGPFQGMFIMPAGGARPPKAAGDYN